MIVKFFINFLFRTLVKSELHYDNFLVIFSPLVVNSMGICRDWKNSVIISCAVHSMSTRLTAVTGTDWELAAALCFCGSLSSLTDLND